MMEWMPPPDGIAMCQCGDVRNHPTRRGHPFRRLPSSASTWQSGSSSCMGPQPTGVPQEAVTRPAPWVSGKASGLHRGHGSMRHVSLLGSRDREAGACRSADPADLRQTLRQAAEERRRRRRSNRRGRLAANHALDAAHPQRACGVEVRRAAGPGNDLFRVL